MPIFIIFLGLAVFIVAFSNNMVGFSDQIGKDINDGYLKWLLAIMILGGTGYIPAARGYTRGIIGLVLLVFLLQKNGDGQLNGAAVVQNAANAAVSKVTPQQNVQTPHPWQQQTQNGLPGDVFAQSGVGGLLGGVVSGLIGVVAKVGTAYITGGLSLGGGASGVGVPGDANTYGPVQPGFTNTSGGGGEIYGPAAPTISGGFGNSVGSGDYNPYTGTGVYNPNDYLKPGQNSWSDGNYTFTRDGVTKNH